MSDTLGVLHDYTKVSNPWEVGQFNDVELERDVFYRYATRVAGTAVTTLGPPTTRTWQLYRRYRDGYGAEFMCTVAGSPGTWIQIAAAVVTANPGSPTTGYWIIRADLNFAQYQWDGAAWVAIGGGGAAWRDGSGAPSAGLGVNGDYYLDDATGNVYAKAAGSYSIVATILGPAGAAGAAGATGATGSPGAAGATGATGSAGAPGSVWRDGSGAPAGGLGVNGDYYLDDSTGNVYLKSAGSYSIVATILGPTGAAGAAGANGAGYAATSTTSTLIGTGSKAFTTQAGLAYVAGSVVRVVRAADSTAWMDGTVASYSGTTLTVTVANTNGSGTFTDWNITLTGSTLLSTSTPQATGAAAVGTATDAARGNHVHALGEFSTDYPPGVTARLNLVLLR